MQQKMGQRADTNKDLLGTYLGFDVAHDLFSAT